MSFTRGKFLLLLLGMVHGEAFAATVDACASISAQLQLVRRMPTGILRKDYQIAVDQTYDQIAKIAFQRYLADSTPPSAFLGCLKSEAETFALNSALSQQFLQQSLEKIQSWGLPRTKKFADEIQKRFKDGYIVSFGVHQNPGEAELDPRLALGGFHRADRGLYLNPEELLAQDWFLIFFHEFSHALDDGFAGELAWAKDASHYADAEAISKKALWSDADKIFVARWLMNGLNRKMLAEYRAWVNTAMLYLDARQGNGNSVSAIASIPWFEDFIGGDHRTPALRKAIFNRIDSSFYDPADSPFGDARFKSMLTDMRQKIRSDAAAGKLPALGSLEAWSY